MNYSILRKAVVAGLLACFTSGSIQAITWEDFVQQNGVPQVVDGKLNLSDKDLENIDFSNIENKEAIEELYLSWNKPQSLPPEIGLLTKLQKLYLGGNQLESLPAQIGQCTNLQTLYLSWNKLQSLPAEIGQLQNLQELYLRNNKLQSLPPEIGQLANRTPEVYISGLNDNEVRELRVRFEKLKNFITKAIKENNLLKVCMFCRERAEPWYLHLNDFRDENGNNLLHLAVMCNRYTGENHESCMHDSAWEILKELIACNIDDSAVKMLKEENAKNNTPLQLLVNADSEALEKMHKQLAQSHNETQKGSKKIEKTEMEKIDE